MTVPVAVPHPHPDLHPRNLCWILNERLTIQHRLGRWGA